MKNTEKKEHKFLKLVNTPVKRVSAFALATVIGVGSVVTVMATTGKATILDNGVSYRVNLTTTNTEELLEKANIQVGSNDIVERDDTNGVVIKIRREIVAPVWADALAVDTEVTAAGFVFVPTNCTSATGAVSERTATSVDSTN